MALPFPRTTWHQSRQLSCRQRNSRHSCHPAPVILYAALCLAHPNFPSRFNLPRNPARAAKQQSRQFHKTSHTAKLLQQGRIGWRGPQRAPHTITLFVQTRLFLCSRLHRINGRFIPRNFPHTLPQFLRKALTWANTPTCDPRHATLSYQCTSGQVVAMS